MPSYNAGQMMTTARDAPGADRAGMAAQSATAANSRIPLPKSTLPQAVTSPVSRIPVKRSSDAAAAPGSGSRSGSGGTGYSLGLASPSATGAPTGQIHQPNRDRGSTSPDDMGLHQSSPVVSKPSPAAAIGGSRPTPPSRLPDIRSTSSAMTGSGGGDRKGIISPGSRFSPAKEIGDKVGGGGQRPAAVGGATPTAAGQQRPGQRSAVVAGARSQPLGGEKANNVVATSSSVAANNNSYSCNNFQQTRTEQRKMSGGPVAGQSKIPLSPTMIQGFATDSKLASPSRIPTMHSSTPVSSGASPAARMAAVAGGGRKGSGPLRGADDDHPAATGPNLSSPSNGGEDDDQQQLEWEANLTYQDLLEDEPIEIDCQSRQSSSVSSAEQSRRESVGKRGRDAADVFPHMQRTSPDGESVSPSKTRRPSPSKIPISADYLLNRSSQECLVQRRSTEHLATPRSGRSTERLHDEHPVDQQQQLGEFRRASPEDREEDEDSADSGAGEGLAPQENYPRVGLHLDFGAGGIQADRGLEEQRGTPPSSANRGVPQLNWSISKESHNQEVHRQPSQTQSASRLPSETTIRGVDSPPATPPSRHSYSTSRLPQMQPQHQQQHQKPRAHSEPNDNDDEGTDKSKRKKSFEAFVMTGDRMINLAKTPGNVDFQSKYYKMTGGGAALPPSERIAGVGASGALSEHEEDDDDGVFEGGGEGEAGVDQEDLRHHPGLPDLLDQDLVPKPALPEDITPPSSISSSPSLTENPLNVTSERRASNNSLNTNKDTCDSSTTTYAQPRNQSVDREAPRRSFVRNSKSDDQLASIDSLEIYDEDLGSSCHTLISASTEARPEDRTELHLNHKANNGYSAAVRPSKPSTYNRLSSSESSSNKSKPSEATSPDISTSSLISCSEHYNGNSLLDNNISPQDIKRNGDLSQQVNSHPKDNRVVIAIGHSQNGGSVDDGGGVLSPLGSTTSSAGTITPDRSHHTTTANNNINNSHSDDNNFSSYRNNNSSSSGSAAVTNGVSAPGPQLQSSAAPLPPSASIGGEGAVSTGEFASQVSRTTSPSSTSPVHSAQATSPLSSGEEDSDLDSLHSYHPPVRNVDIPSASRLAKRLYNLEGFKKGDISRQLSKNNEFCRAVAEEYCKLFDLTSTRLDEALRRFLCKFNLVGETQERERILLYFSKRYLECNPGLLGDAYMSQDAVHTLACAIMLLNTDLHNHSLHQRKMTSEDFVDNLRELNDGQNFPRDLLLSVYAAIRSQPIQWASLDQEGEEDNLSEHMTPNNAAAIGTSVDPDNDGAVVNSGNGGHEQHSYGGSTGAGVTLGGNQAGGFNPFLSLPNSVTACDYKRGYLIRKACLDANGKRTKLGQRGWKMFHLTLRNLVLYCFKDETSAQIPGAFENPNNAIRIHHSLASVANDYRKKQFVFRLQTCDRAEYLFHTSNQQELVSWVDAINTVVARYSAPPLPAPVSSNAKFQRPLYPSSQSKLNLMDQLASHKQQLATLKDQLYEHGLIMTSGGAGKKATNSQQLVEKAEFLEFEIDRYTIYVDSLEGILTKEDYQLNASPLKVLTT